MGKNVWAENESHPPSRNLAKTNIVFLHRGESEFVPGGGGRGVKKEKKNPRGSKRARARKRRRGDNTGNFDPRP